jgi:hypothetical protein
MFVAAAVVSTTGPAAACVAVVAIRPAEMLVPAAQTATHRLMPPIDALLMRCERCCRLAAFHVIRPPWNVFMITPRTSYAPVQIHTLSHPDRGSITRPGISA